MDVPSSHQIFLQSTPNVIGKLHFLRVWQPIILFIYVGVPLFFNNPLLGLLCPNFMVPLGLNIKIRSPHSSNVDSLSLCNLSLHNNCFGLGTNLVATLCILFRSLYVFYFSLREPNHSSIFKHQSYHNVISLNISSFIKLNATSLSTIQSSYLHAFLEKGCLVLSLLNLLSLL